MAAQKGAALRGLAVVRDEEPDRWLHSNQSRGFIGVTSLDPVTSSSA